jgi:hypothetical protein
MIWQYKPPVMGNLQQRHPVFPSLRHTIQGDMLPAMTSARLIVFLGGFLAATGLQNTAEVPAPSGRVAWQYESGG